MAVDFVCLFLTRLYFLSYLFMTVLSLHGCAWAFSIWGEQDYSLPVAHWFLIALTPLVAEPRL